MFSSFYSLRRVPIWINYTVTLGLSERSYGLAWKGNQGRKKHEDLPEGEDVVREGS